MARSPRLALAGHAHHVVQRGHNRQPVFVDSTDRQAYLDGLHEAAATLRVAVHGFVLLSDQVQLLVTPRDAADLSRLMQALGRRYVAAFNRRHGHVGTLWEGRFRAAIVQADQHLLQALRCLEQAPVREGLCAQAAAWPWSSAGHHLGVVRVPLLTDATAYWALGNTPFERQAEWQRLLAEPLGDAEAQAIVDRALKGTAWGTGAFLAQVAVAANRPLQPRPRGRPKAVSAANSA